MASFSLWVSEVMSGLSAKKQAKVKQSQLEAAEKAGRRKERAARGSDSAAATAAGRSVSEDPFQVNFLTNIKTILNFEGSSFDD